jgi:hypothetical protein
VRWRLGAMLAWPSENRQRIDDDAQTERPCASDPTGREHEPELMAM